VFLIEVEPRWAPALASRLEAQLGRLGFRTTASAERLRSFSGVTDASLSAFQALSALGLLAGIVGFAAAEFGRARAARGAPALAVLVEAGWQVCAGLTIGAAAALVVLAPTVIGRAFYN
jgi:hypothetical protein